jgi:hypothetical protein
MKEYERILNNICRPNTYCFSTATIVSRTRLVRFIRTLLALLRYLFTSSAHTGRICYSPIDMKLIVPVFLIHLSPENVPVVSRYSIIYRVSREECARLRENVP